MIQHPKPHKTNPMKKTLLALALAAGLTSFAGSAKADLVFDDDSNLSYQADLTEDQATLSSYQTDYYNNYGGYLAAVIDATNAANNRSKYNVNNAHSFNEFMMINFFYQQYDNAYNNAMFSQYRYHSLMLQDQVNIDAVNSDMSVDASEFAAATAAAATAAVPEPSQVAASLLLAAGIAGFVIVKRRKEASELEVLAA